MFDLLMQQQHANASRKAGAKPSTVLVMAIPVHQNLVAFSIIWLITMVLQELILDGLRHKLQLGNVILSGRETGVPKLNSTGVNTAVDFSVK